MYIDPIWKRICRDNYTILKSVSPQVSLMCDLCILVIQKDPKTCPGKWEFPITSVYFRAEHSPKTPKAENFLAPTLSAEEDRVKFSASVNRQRNM